jgi:hypothetical protein
MAKPTTIVTSADAPLSFGVDGMPEHTVAEILAAHTAEPSAQGIVVWNGSTAVRYTGQTDVDGNPVMIKLTIRAVRSPLTVGEADACAKLAEEAEFKKLTKADGEQKTREREIVSAREHTLAGMQAQATIAATVSTADKVREALTLASVLSEAMATQKRLA